MSLFRDVKVWEIIGDKVILKSEREVQIHQYLDA